MRIGMPISYDGGYDRTTAVIADFEKAGLDTVYVAEAYSFDAVSHLGYLAARTTTVEIASGILNIYSRTPTLLAMTAAGLDFLSGGRFTLGIGASGPQVVEGFHGVPYTAPLATTREVVEVCRAVWRREKIDHHGAHVDIPLTPDRGGSGLGKPLKLINKPVRERIPMLLAAIGPKNVAMAAELFEAWQPAFFLPEGSAAAFGEALAEGTARRDPELGPLQVVADSQLLISEDADEQAAALDRVRAKLALYVGGMGARGKNFYNELAGRYGFADQATTVQDLYLDGRKDEAAAALPEEFVRGVALVGPRGHVAERLAAFREAGVTTLNVTPLAAEHGERLRAIETLKALA
ncbi:LLM class F420-dependent oxidoreductase [Blastococcus sp. KM273129]|uniref:LLM class F420-dependent oxidoreductase n=1 Tax=Blastococcus sp. KM273129 TaxID=2570315 RepID=UPI001F3C9432|nr:LLM class F420-dependent oxidoreductase [Blastococcus sp. KM273129]MCF6737198.1 LLM class F420-dependent oxidoreductase [Blastococcus sp. KM273129]